MPDFPRAHSERALTTKQPRALRNDADVRNEAGERAKVAGLATKNLTNDLVKWNTYVEGVQEDTALFNYKTGVQDIAAERAVDNDISGASETYYQQKMKDLRQNVLTGIDSDRVKKGMAPQLDYMETVGNIGLQSDLRKKVVLADHALTMKFIDNEIQHPTDDSLENIKKYLAGKVAIGSFNKKVAYQLERQANKDLGVSRVSHDLNKADTPEKVEAISQKLQSGGYETGGVVISPEEKKSLIQNAESAKKNRQKQIDEKIKVSQTERTNNFLSTMAERDPTMRDIDTEAAIPEEEGGMPRKLLNTYRNTVIRGISQDLNRLLTEKDHKKQPTQRSGLVKQYLALVDDMMDDGSDQLKAKEMLALAYQDGVINPKEQNFLNNLKQGLQDIEWNRRTDPIASGIKELKGFLRIQMNAPEDEIARQVKELVGGMIDGVKPEDALKKMYDQNLIKVFPDLSSYPKTGQIKEDEQGNRIRVFPDSTYADIGDMETE